MSDVDVNVKKLEVIETLKDGIDIGVKNISSILVNLFFWVVTIWIPYINVGTTIGMFVGIVSKVSRGEVIPFTEIFAPKYRKCMGECFLVLGFVLIGTVMGLLFFIVPGFVIALAWSFAPLLVVDKGKNPAEAISLSNNITYGNKGRMFLINIIPILIFTIVQEILRSFDTEFTSFLILIIIVFQMFVSIGIQASMYKQLAGNI
ncbi:MAG: hypothetical protein LBI04_11110 [Treponema sp.]|jgi:hypothetical protein|nr:hypothetical protein [Treponema sp.]